MTMHELSAKPNGPIPEAIPAALKATIAGAEELEIPLALIDPNPNQPRQYFNEEEEQALADSIAADGQLNAGIAYRDPETGRYKLLGGHRRFRVLGRLGKEKMRLRVLKEAPDKAKQSRIELLDNELHKSLSRLEQGFAWETHIKLVGCTASAVAQTLGTSVSTITRAIKDSQRLCTALRERLRAGTLPPEIAEQLLPLPADAQVAIAQQYPNTLRTKSEVRAAVRKFKNGNGQATARAGSFTCEESGVRIAFSWANCSSDAQAMSQIETALRVVLKDLTAQKHRGLAHFKHFLDKKAKAARKAAELKAAQDALAGLAGTSGTGSN